jgi:hypothetical protein
MVAEIIMRFDDLLAACPASKPAAQARPAVSGVSPLHRNGGVLLGGTIQARASGPVRPPAPNRGLNFDKAPEAWLTRTDLWRHRTNPRKGSARLSGIGPMMCERENGSLLHLSHMQSEERPIFDPLC